MDLTVNSLNDMGRLVHTAENEQGFVFRPFNFNLVDPSFSYIENYLAEVDETRKLNDVGNDNEEVDEKNSIKG